MFKVMIRGIPNFMHLQYVEVSSVEEAFSLFEIRVKDSSFASKCEAFYTGTMPTKKRVLAYIFPGDHSPEILDKYTDKLTAKPSATNALLLGMSGTGKAHDGEWQALDMTKHPDYPAKLAQYNADMAQKREAQRLANEREEQENEALQSALSDALDRLGYDALHKLLTTV